MAERRAAPDRLIEIVAADLRPVRRLWRPWHRALALAPLAAVAAILAFRSYGRPDLASLEPWLTWGLSALQWIGAIVVFAIALREAVPGSGYGSRATAAAAAAAAASVAGITWLTYGAHPAYVPPAYLWRVAYLCFTGSFALGLPLMAAAVVLASRATPTTPARVGALCGLAAGLAVDAGWRLTCHFSAPSHVLGSHAAAIGALVATGAVTAVLVDRWRSNRRAR